MENFFFYFKWGISHILDWEALDHLLFMVSMIALYRFKDWKSLLLLVTSFTIGHSISLILCTWKIINLNNYIIECVIPLTIVVTASQNLFQRMEVSQKMGLKYLAALFFGFIHGMGFANTLQFVLNPSENQWIPLLGFNLGIEFSQICIMAGILYVGDILVELVGLRFKRWSMFLSLMALIGGVILFIQRWRI